MKVSRRQFTGSLVSGVFGGLLVYRLGPAAPGDSPARNAESAGDIPDWAFVVDTRRCIGCGRCVLACSREAGLPEDGEFVRTWVERYLITSGGEIHVDSPEAGRHGFDSWQHDPENTSPEVRKSFFVPKLCNHCEKPPCVQVCPVGATFKTADGVILVNERRCIGCGYCVQACPYGSRFINPKKRVADKCTWCYHRIVNGQPPVCVEVCPVGARRFGDLRDAESTVSQMMKQERLDVLKPDLGTVPRVRYAGIDEGVR